MAIKGACTETCANLLWNQTIWFQSILRAQLLLGSIFSASRDKPDWFVTRACNYI